MFYGHNKIRRYFSIVIWNDIIKTKTNILEANYYSLLEVV